TAAAFGLVCSAASAIGVISLSIHLTRWERCNSLAIAVGRCAGEPAAGNLLAVGHPGAPSKVATALPAHADGEN
ncbi:MAG: hypothetical protein P4L82_08085, partial [Ancalomicrobiaceae bacterium]|nr:hypothetical protein [Ancalomicrobiaceae bacterium]